MLGQLAGIFEGHLFPSKATKYRIELTSRQVRPIHSAPHRAGPKVRVLKKEKLEKMTKMGVIEASHTEWASPIVFVPKKD